MHDEINALAPGKEYIEEYKAKDLKFRLHRRKVKTNLIVVE